MLKSLLYLIFFASPQALAAELVVSSVGVTYHGGAVGQEISDEMPHKITDDGKLVFHPQTLGLNLILSSSLHLSLTYLKDCFDQQAMLFGIGNHWHPLSRIGLGYLAGLYIRDTYYFIDSNGHKNTLEEFPTAIDGGDKQYIPMAMLTASAQLLKEGNFALTLIAAGNWYINHLQLGMSMDL